MQLIAIVSARVTLLFPVEEVLPLEGGNGPTIVETVGKRYSFTRLPDLSVSREELNKNGLRFEGGRFEFESIQTNIRSISIHNDGLNVDANTTEAAEAFLRDFIDFLRTNFQFREFASTPRIYFWSQVVAEFQHPLERLISGHDKIEGLINKSLREVHGPEISPAQFARVDFACDATKMRAGFPVPRFFIERRVGTPFDRERYFCGAPMRTRDLLHLLDEIEQLLPAH
jgi:hypothetical protein